MAFVIPSFELEFYFYYRIINVEERILQASFS